MQPSTMPYCNIHIGPYSWECYKHFGLLTVILYYLIVYVIYRLRHYNIIIIVYITEELSVGGNPQCIIINQFLWYE